MEKTPLKNAFAELFNKGEYSPSYRAESSPNGDFLFADIKPGAYILRISTPESVEFVRNVTITGDGQTDLGTIQGGGLFDYEEGGEIYTAAKPTKTTLPCRDKFKLLRDPVPDELLLSSFELEDLAIRIERPKWPPDTDPECSVGVMLIMDKNGNVACAAVDETIKNDPRAKAAISAAMKSKFRPVVRDGIPVPAMGILRFGYK